MSNNNSFELKKIRIFNFIDKIFYHLKKMVKLLYFITLFTVMTLNSAFADDLIKAREGFLLTVGRFEMAILKLNPKLSKKQVTKLATLISIESKKNKIDPRIILAILNTESSFNQKAFNKNQNGSTDISIAQINTSAWNPSVFEKRIGLPLDVKKLKKDEAYAISRMSLILGYLKENFSKNDKWWFARYHSATPEFKSAYLRRLAKNFRLLKPFGQNLLKDMPDIKYLAKIKRPLDLDRAVAMNVSGGNKNAEID